MNKTFKKISFGLIGFLVLIGLDQWSKSLAGSMLKLQGEKELIPGVFSLQYLQNHGAAFGIMQNKQWIFLILGLIFLLLAAFVYLRTPATKRMLPLRLITLLIAAGAVGNMIDRIAYGYVIDYFYFKLIDFPIFNVADIYITVGAALMIIFVLFVYKDEDFEYLTGKKNKSEEKKED